MNFTQFIARDSKECERLDGKIFNLGQLLDARKTTQPIAIIHYLASEITANAWHFLQVGGIGTIQEHMHASLQLHGITQGVALVHGVRTLGGDEIGCWTIVVGYADVRFSTQIGRASCRERV